MKTRFKLVLLFLASMICLFLLLFLVPRAHAGAGPVVQPASQAAVNTGDNKVDFVTPYTLMRALGWSTSGITSMQWTQFFNARIVAAVGSNNAATATGLALPIATATSNAFVNLVHSNTAALPLDGSNIVGTVPAATNLMGLPRFTWFVATNGNDSNPGTFSQPFLTPMKAAISATAGQDIKLLEGQFSIGTNQIILGDFVHLEGLGYERTEILGYADCSGVENGRPTGGPQIRPGSGSVLRDFTVTCDTNALWSLSPNIGTSGCIYSGTWSGIGDSYLNPPADGSFTNVLIERVRVRRGYFDALHFNTLYQNSVTVKDCVLEQDGGDLVNVQTASVNASNMLSTYTIINTSLVSKTNSLYAAYVNGSNPRASAGSETVATGNQKITFIDCAGKVDDGPLTPTSTTNQFVVINGRFSGNSPVAYAVTYSGIYNGAVLNQMAGEVVMGGGGITNTIDGTVVATAVTGDGSGLTQLPGNQVTSGIVGNNISAGTIDFARLASPYYGNISRTNSETYTATGAGFITLTNYSRIATNAFASNLALGSLTNVIAGTYAASFSLSIDGTGPNGGKFIAAIFTNGVQAGYATVNDDAEQFLAPEDSTMSSAPQIFTVPANCRWDLRIWGTLSEGYGINHAVLDVLSR